MGFITPSEFCTPLPLSPRSASTSPWEMIPQRAELTPLVTPSWATPSAAEVARRAAQFFQSLPHGLVGIGSELEPSRAVGIRYECWKQRLRPVVAVHGETR